MLTARLSHSVRTRNVFSKRTALDSNLPNGTHMVSPDEENILAVIKDSTCLVKMRKNTRIRIIFRHYYCYPHQRWTLGATRQCMASLIDIHCIAKADTFRSLKSHPIHEIFTQLVSSSLAWRCLLSLPFLHGVISLLSIKVLLPPRWTCLPNFTASHCTFCSLPVDVEIKSFMLSSIKSIKS